MTSTPSKYPTTVVPDVVPCSVFLDERGYVRLLVVCPHCGGLHRHAPRPDFEAVLADCQAGRYVIRWEPGTELRDVIQVVPCRSVAGEWCVACGPDADRLYAKRTIALADVVS